MPLNLKKLIYFTLAIAICVVGTIYLYNYYQTKFVTNKINEALVIISTAQNAVINYAQDHSGLDESLELNNAAFGLPQPMEINDSGITNIIAHKYSNSSTVMITATIDTNKLPSLKLDNQQTQIRFTAQYINNTLEWICSANIKQNYLPKNCNSTYDNETK